MANTLNDWIEWKDLGKGRVRLRVFDQGKHLARVIQISQPAQGEANYQVSVQIFSADPDGGGKGMKKRVLKVDPAKDTIGDMQGGRVGQIEIE
jgi:hypothetical protein